MAMLVFSFLVPMAGGQGALDAIDGEPLQNAGHILGKHSYLWRWGAGADESTKTVEWLVRADSGTEITVEVRAAQAGRDRASIVLGN